MRCLLCLRLFLLRRRRLRLRLQDAVADLHHRALLDEVQREALVRHAVLRVAQHEAALRQLELRRDISVFVEVKGCFHANRACIHARSGRRGVHVGGGRGKGRVSDAFGKTRGARGEDTTPGPTARRGPPARAVARLERRDIRIRRFSAREPTARENERRRTGNARARVTLARSAGLSAYLSCAARRGHPRIPRGPSTSPASCGSRSRGRSEWTSRLRLRGSVHLATRAESRAHHACGP